MKVHIGRYPKNNGERKVSVRIDKHDTYNMDSTLALIVVPMLKQLKDTKHGAPLVDDEDVPMKLRRTEPQDEDTKFNTDDNWFARWDYVMDEMIFAFESKLTDWETQFWATSPKIDFKEYPEDVGKEFVPLRWEVEGVCDWQLRSQYEARIQNGFRLFGKYYQGLWD